MVRAFLVGWAVGVTTLMVALACSAKFGDEMLDNRRRS